MKVDCFVLLSFLMHSVWNLRILKTLEKLLRNSQALMGLKKILKNKIGLKTFFQNILHQAIFPQNYLSSMSLEKPVYILKFEILYFRSSRLVG